MLLQQPELGQKLKALRKRLRFGLDELAAESGLSKTTIAELESGKRKNTHISTLEKLCASMRVTLAYLYVPTKERDASHAKAG